MQGWTITPTPIGTSCVRCTSCLLYTSGPGFTPRQLEELNRALPREENGRHVGLANTLRRFQLLYGDDLAVAFANGREGGAKIELFLPLQAITKGDKEDETADRG